MKRLFAISEEGHSIKILREFLPLIVSTQNNEFNCM